MAKFSNLRIEDEEGAGEEDDKFIVVPRYQEMLIAKMA